MSPVLRCLILFLAGLSALVYSAPAEVRLAEKAGNWTLLRHDEPYFIKGAGGDRATATLAQAGGNSIRVWSDDHLGEQLDAAQKAGLTVAAGFWLGQVRQGFDWSDAAGLIQQRERLRATVKKYRDHPALLLWVLGNEMEDPEGKNGAVWSVVFVVFRTGFGRLTRWLIFSARQLIFSACPLFFSARRGR